MDYTDLIEDDTWKLEQLKLDTSWGSRIVRTLTYKYPHVTVLQLGFNRLCDQGIKDLSELFLNNKTIKTLDIPFNKISAVGISSLQRALQNNSTLTKLNLHSNPLHTDGANGIQKILKNTSCAIVDLNLGNCKLGDVGLSIITQALEHNSSLKKLTLDNNLISKRGCKMLCDILQKNDNINHLDLHSNILGSGAAYFGEVLEKNNALVILNIADNTIGSDVVKSLTAALAKNSTLRSLDLSENYIQEDDISLIERALDNNFTLTKLDLRFNKFRYNLYKVLIIEMVLLDNNTNKDYIAEIKEMNTRARNLYVFKHVCPLPFFIKQLLCFSDYFSERENLRLTDFFFRNGFLRLTKKLIEKFLRDHHDELEFLSKRAKK